ERVFAALAVCYGVALCGLAMQTIRGRFRLKKALKFRSAPSERLSRVFREVSLVVPSRNATLWILPGLPSPATFGWLRPRVIVPAECEEHSISDLEGIFWHELSHVRRRDVLWNTFLRGCRSLLCFHPCIHFAFSAISTERELACDQDVIEGLPVGRDSYAACLVRFARARAVESAASPCIELTSGAAVLRLRVESILTEAPHASIGSVLRRTMAGLAMLATIGALSPELKVLLVARQAARVVASFASAPIHEATFHAKHGSTRSRRTVAAITPTSAMEPRLQPAAPSILPETNPALAAAHKVGMNVLTEYGNSQQEQSRDRRSQDDRSDRSSQPVTKLQPAWGSIALGALENLGSVGLDHDHDRH
ncbi:MAG TPA: M56 family metallopeptidase, partial [Edaphobacter sp.]|nr:M56 family metallopeptidase [Edaphobacter sp.]